MIAVPPLGVPSNTINPPLAVAVPVLLSGLWITNSPPASTRSLPAFVESPVGSIDDERGSAVCIGRTACRLSNMFDN